MKDICRLCLFKGNELFSIYDYKEINLVNRIKECVQLDVDINEHLFPSFICINCLLQLNQWIKFRDKCNESQNFLLKSIKNNLFTNNVKNETEENNEQYSNPNDDNNSTKSKNIEIISECKSKIDYYIMSDNKYKSNSYINNLDKLTNICEKQRRISSECKSENEYSDEEKFDSDTYLQSIEENNDNSINQFINLNNYICDICECTFQSIFDYLDHQQIHDGEPVFKCDKCSKVFNSRRDLVVHDSRHKIPCPKCGKIILSISMKQHLISHTDRFKCRDCCARFNNKLVLHQHIQSIHLRLKSYTCETCGKSFTSPQSLWIHKKIHSEDRPYKCKICDHSARTSSGLYVHMYTHEDGLNVCEICAKSFKSLRSIRDHKRRVHSDVKNHECGICKIKFNQKYLLIVHMRTHTGARPYQCKLCDKAFVRSDGLKEHLVTHGERKSYSCSKCEKKFIYRRSLTRHNCTTV